MFGIKAEKVDNAAVSRLVMQIMDLRQKIAGLNVRKEELEAVLSDLLPDGAKLATSYGDGEVAVVIKFPMSAGGMKPIHIATYPVIK